jgi:hypothetical protein
VGQTPGRPLGPARIPLDPLFHLYDPKDPYAHYALGLSYMRKAVQNGSYAELDPALRHFHQVLTINGDIAEAEYAKQNIASIEKALQNR